MSASVLRERAQPIRQEGSWAVRRLVNRLALWSPSRARTRKREGKEGGLMRESGHNAR